VRFTTRDVALLANQAIRVTQDAVLECERDCLLRRTGVEHLLGNRSRDRTQASSCTIGSAERARDLVRQAASRDVGEQCHKHGTAWLRRLIHLTSKA
jgi:hypothetical protein